RSSVNLPPLVPSAARRRAPVNCRPAPSLRAGHFPRGLFRGELPCGRIARAYIDRLAVEVRASIFLETQRFSRLTGYFPAGGQDVRAYLAMNECDVARGETSRLDAGEPALFYIRRRGERAV